MVVVAIPGWRIDGDRGSVCRLPIRPQPPRRGEVERFRWRYVARGCSAKPDPAALAGGRCSAIKLVSREMAWGVITQRRGERFMGGGEIPPESDRGGSFRGPLCSGRGGGAAR